LHHHLLNQLLMPKSLATGFPVAIIFFISSFFLATEATSQTAGRITRTEYVEAYKEIAISEMHAYGIPASIKLAQAILESGSGNSRLARDANNHFGIKCHGWQGRTIRADDDAPQECFRAYDNAGQSFRDHSLFLTTRPRYAALFDLDITDYKGWARGLRKSGYATNPRYADLLIKIIEELQLYRFDTISADMLAETRAATQKSSAYDARGKVAEVKGKRTIFTNNDRKFIIAKPADNFFKIAEEFNIYSFQIWKYNELTRNDKLVEGEMVYLEKKRRKAAVPFHTVSQGETMRSISQLYGIRLNRLYRLNRMDRDEKPRVGQVLWLQDRKPRE
jgi:glycosyltransferase involved in cell wall biosynthesis